MKSTSQSALKTSAKAGWLLFSNLIFITLFGLLINWASFLFLATSIWKESCQTGPIGAHAGGIGAVIGLIFICLACFKPIGMTVLFVVLFPILYFLVGKSRGIKKALAYLIQENQAWLLERIRPLLIQIVNRVRQKGFPKEGKERNQSIASMLSKAGDFLENTSGWMRWVIRFLLARTQAARWIQEVQGLRDDHASEESITMQLEARMQEKISGLTQVDSKDLMILAMVNASAIALTYWYVH